MGYSMVYNMSRNLWGDRVYEQKRHYGKKKFTKQDEFFAYLKIAGIFVLGAIYFYLIWF